MRILGRIISLDEGKTIEVEVGAAEAAASVIFSKNSWG